MESPALEASARFLSREFLAGGPSCARYQRAAKRWSAFKSLTCASKHCDSPDSLPAPCPARDRGAMLWSGYDYSQALCGRGWSTRDLLLGDNGLDVLIGCHTSGNAFLEKAGSTFAHWSQKHLLSLSDTMQFMWARVTVLSSRIIFAP